MKAKQFRAKAMAVEIYIFSKYFDSPNDFAFQSCEVFLKYSQTSYEQSTQSQGYEEKLFCDPKCH